MRTALAASYEPSICASATPSDKRFTQKTPQWAEDIRKSFTFPARRARDRGWIAHCRASFQSPKLPLFSQPRHGILVSRSPSVIKTPHYWCSTTPLSLFPGRRPALSILIDRHPETSLMAKSRQARKKRTKESRCTSFVGKRLAIAADSMCCRPGDSTTRRCITRNIRLLRGSSSISTN
jgi:hypothetical protein